MKQEQLIPAFFAIMSLFISSLNSGSNGNCYYVGNQQEAILVDAGISCREVEKRMLRSGLDMKKVKAVFISHEHTDHIKGLSLIAKKYCLPVYFTKGTLHNTHLMLEKKQAIHLSYQEPVSIGSLNVTAFSKQHDAADPCSFVVTCNDINVGIFTDLGIPCSNLVKHFTGCHAAFLESNYDEEMLEKGNYPYYLKKRIAGGMGHLSNRQALDLFLQHRTSNLSHLILSHLSHNNNCPKLVKSLFDKHANGVEMVVASRFEETPVFHITGSACVNAVVVKKKAQPTPQLSFSFA